MTSFEGLLPKPSSATPAEGTFVSDEPVEPSVTYTGSLPPEGYRITITPQGVEVAAADEAGAFYASQTLRQLHGADRFRAASIHTGPWELPCGTIEDAPRFGWRGVLLDVARHFKPKYEVFRFIDLMAAHKLNVLHLHLTDDQGWRIEVPAYPKLTEVASWRTGSWVGRPPDGTKENDGRPHGGFYTTADLREIVAYARERHITIVPEVDVPGHSQAAIAAYPELGNTGEQIAVRPEWGISEDILNVSDATVEFYKTVLDHVMDVFDSPVICIGGDEVPTVQWNDNPIAAQRMAEQGYTSVAQLHGWFLGQLAAHLTKHGRRALGWDEMLDVGDLPDDAVVGSWRGEEAGATAASSGHDVVMCPEQYVYLDHRQSRHPDEPIPVGFVHTLEDVYGYEPIPPGLKEEFHKHVLGAQAQAWSEHMDNFRRVEYMTFPRLAAFAEVVWSAPAGRSYEEFEARLVNHHLARLDAMGVEYRPLTGPHPWQTRPGVPVRMRELQSK
ncbi:beta-N-acetylhexosaminidase [Actinosynnema sp. ALI-1.44]|uniref:beta-N-acetylhexosaminidase n=1 Tax=Actinosynnema sp. ALI-1.44 TaxID=1933779 RepID=UPI00097C9F75|nr:beta-N-acetylhexosaminidase [Actinosynnema sp. ALI-1.44]ONI71051.1 beta-N-acetylhexosaminidase [Actinosynnema sp. ALI-1.44]